MRAVYGLSSLLSILFLLRPCTFNKPLLLSVLLCTSYILMLVGSSCVTKAFIPIRYYLRRTLLGILNICTLILPVLMH